MGNILFDQYTYLHFAVGIIVYFWNIPLLNWFVLHTIFEVLENSQMGINFINNYLVFWPGGKPKPDSILNVIGDTYGAIIGWLSAYYLDKIGNKYGWYTLHIK
jgi:hypothetical protein